MTDEQRARQSSATVVDPLAPQRNDPLRALVDMLLFWTLVDDENIAWVRIFDHGSLFGRLSDVACKAKRNGNTIHSSTNGRGTKRQESKKIEFTKSHPCQANYVGAAIKFTGIIRTPKGPKTTKTQMRGGPRHFGEEEKS